VAKALTTSTEDAAVATEAQVDEAIEQASHEVTEDEIEDGEGDLDHGNTGEDIDEDDDDSYF
jgi:hypothetical protein